MINLAPQFKGSEASLAGLIHLRHRVASGYQRQALTALCAFRTFRPFNPDSIPSLRLISPSACAAKAHCDGAVHRIEMDSHLNKPYLSRAGSIQSTPRQSEGKKRVVCIWSYLLAKAA
jgi:hypothetical protein